MRAATAKRVERIIERTASASFAGAAGFAAYNYWIGNIAQPTLGAYTGGVAAIAYLLAVRTLRGLGNERRYPVAIFDLRKIDAGGPDELVLTDADRLRPSSAADDEPLVLDDILAELGPDARVVRLFDRSAMPTPGQLKSRIDSHLGDTASPGTLPDASQALSDALAELRRSLR